MNLKHTCGCVIGRVHTDRYTTCQHHGATWTYALAALKSPAAQFPEGPRPSTHKLCGCGELRPFGHYFCAGEFCRNERV